MKRISALFTGAMLAAGLLQVIPATPVSAAETDLCAGTGSANVHPGLYYPGGPLRRNATFGAALDGYPPAPGFCAFKGAASANGIVSGYCGLSFGAGTTSQLHDFIFVGIGGKLFISGEVSGVVEATPDVANGESCVPPSVSASNDGANRFVLFGSVALVASNVLGPTANPVQELVNGL